MKKIIALLLTVSLILTLAACGSQNQESESSAETSAAPTETVTEEEKDEGVSVDQGLLFTTITLPASYFEDESEDEIISAAKEQGIESCVVNPDGSVTYKMTKAKHKELLDTMLESIDDSLTEMVSGENAYESFTDIERNDDCTEFTIYADGEKYENSWDAFGVLGIYILGAYYQMFDGVDEDDIDIAVTVIDNESKEEIQSSSYREWMENVDDDTEESENEETSFNNIAFGETFTVGDVAEITIDSYEWCDEIYPSNTNGVYSYYSDEDGETYFVARGTLKNIATDSVDIQWLSENELSINDTYNYDLTMVLESNDGDDFYGEAKPLQTLNLVVYGSIPDEAVEIFENGRIEMNILSSSENLENFFSTSYPYESYAIDIN